MSENGKRIVITGGTGLIGRRLVEMLHERGYETTLLTRNRKARSPESYYWNYHEGIIDASALEGAHAIIHLAGASVGEGRWSAHRKNEIIESRVKTTELLLEKIGELQNKPKAFISASAVGYYGDRGDEELSESSGSGEGFLATVVNLWEEAVQRANSLGMRTVMLRTGVVLHPEKGALPKMAGPVKAFIGSALGNGSQYLPWIHLDDICRIYLHALENDIVFGVFNACAPGEETNLSFTKKLGKALHRPVFFPPVPAFILRILLGEMSHLVLDSNRVKVEKIKNTNFEFSYPDLDNALIDIYK